MQIHHEDRNGVIIVSVEGSIDALTAEEIQRYFDEVVDHRPENVVLNLEGVDFMSSAGLRVIMSISKTLRAVGGDLRLAAAQPSVEKMLKISGFTSILKSFSDVEAAERSFRN